MSWLITVTAGWTFLAVLLGLLVGNGIRIQRGAECPARAGATDPPSGQATEQPTTVGADPAGEVAAATGR